MLKPTKPILPLTFAAVVLSALTTLAGSFTNGFTTTSQTGFSFTGSGFTPVIESGHLVLTRNANSQQGTIILKDLDAGELIDSFVVSFKLQIGPGSGNPADGVAFSFDPSITATSNFGEEGTGTAGVTVCFDTYDNGGGEAPAVDVKYAGAILFTKKYVKADLVTSKFEAVRIEVTRSGLLSLGYKGQILCTNLVLPNYTPMAGLFALGARTGGENENAYIDDLSVTTTVYAGDVAPSIITQPQSQTIAEGAGVTFAVNVDATAPVTFAWYKNGEAVPDVIGPILTLPQVFYADHNAVFSCEISNPAGTIISDPATLTVIRDAAKPTLVSAQSALDLSHVTVAFSEPVSQLTAEDPASYHINGLEILAVAQNPPNGTNVILTTALQDEGLKYTLTVNNVEDLATSPNVIVPESKIDFLAFVFSPGFLHFWTFDTPEPTTDTTVPGLTNCVNYPNNPMAKFLLNTFDSRLAYPNDTNDHYGAFMVGFFVPPESGNWLFYLKSDDNGELWLNPNGADPAEAQLIIEAPYCCKGFADSPSQPVPLTAGEHYFIMGLYKEGGGGDFMQVAAKLDSDPTDANFLHPISGRWLGCYADPTGAALAIKRQPTNQFSTDKVMVTNQVFQTNNGYFTVLSYGNPGKPWAYNSSSKTWLASDQSTCGTLFRTSALSSPDYQVVSPGPLTLNVVHRFSFEQDTENWDGGQLWLSVNGAPYQAIPNEQFTARGYTGTVGSGGQNPNCIFRGQEAFVGKSTGYDAATFITSTVNLGDFNTGDTLSVQFLAGWDDCAENTEPNWQVRSLGFSPAVQRALKPVTFTAQVEAALPGTTNPAVSVQWQIDRGAGFVDIPGATSLTNTFLPSLTDHGAKLRALVFLPGTAGVVSDTAILSLEAPTVVSLTITRSDPNVVISWPADSAGYALEETTQLTAGATWTPVSGTPTVNGNTKSLTLPAAARQNFYRLRK
jgi:hypothetical protein